jgi:hypothetical protein
MHQGARDELYVSLQWQAAGRLLTDMVVPEVPGIPYMRIVVVLACVGF